MLLSDIISYDYIEWHKTNARKVVVHGSVANTPRPEGYTFVEWIGSVEPLNSLDNDTWFNNTAVSVPGEPIGGLLLTLTKA